MISEYFVYILANCNNTTFYIGVTNSLERRVYEHQNKLVPGFSKKYNLNKLVYYEIGLEIKSAIIREKQLKNWHRDWKINLVKSRNPNFIDLVENKFQFPKTADPETSSG